jgi:hypothetical protein
VVERDANGVLSEKSHDAGGLAAKPIASLCFAELEYWRGDHATIAKDLHGSRSCDGVVNGTLVRALVEVAEKVDDFPILSKPKSFRAACEWATSTMLASPSSPILKVLPCTNGLAGVATPRYPSWRVAVMLTGSAADSQERRCQYVPA